MFSWHKKPEPSQPQYKEVQPDQPIEGLERVVTEDETVFKQQVPPEDQENRS